MKARTAATALLSLLLCIPHQAAHAVDENVHRYGPVRFSAAVHDDAIPPGAAVLIANEYTQLLYGDTPPDGLRFLGGYMFPRRQPVALRLRAALTRVHLPDRQIWGYYAVVARKGGLRPGTARLLNARTRSPQAQETLLRLEHELYARHHALFAEQTHLAVSDAVAHMVDFPSIKALRFACRIRNTDNGEQWLRETYCYILPEYTFEIHMLLPEGAVIDEWLRMLPKAVIPDLPGKSESPARAKLLSPERISSERVAQEQAPQEK